MAGRFVQAVRRLGAVVGTLALSPLMIVGVVLIVVILVGDGGELAPRQAFTAPPADNPLSLDDLPRDASQAAGTALSDRLFVSMQWDKDQKAWQEDGLTKWIGSDVTVHLADYGGPGMRRYVRGLLDTLNRIQPATRFHLVTFGGGQITIKFVSRDEFADFDYPRGMVGLCKPETDAKLGMTAAHIFVDADTLKSTDQRRAVVVHELTHALGFSGHICDWSSSTSSVLYYRSCITSWSQEDAIAIRELYTPWMRSGFTPGQARLALEHNTL